MGGEPLASIPSPTTVPTLVSTAPISLQGRFWITILPGSRVYTHYLSVIWAIRVSNPVPPGCRPGALPMS